MRDAKIIFYGSLVLAVVVVFTVALVRFIRAGRSRSTKNVVFFTSSLTVLIEAVMLALTILTDIGYSIAEILLPVAFWGGLIFFFGELIFRKRTSTLSKAMISVPLTIIGSVIAYIGIALIDIMFLGGDWP